MKTSAPALILFALVAYSLTAFAAEPEPQTIVRNGVKELLDIPYVEKGHERQKLNLFLPEKKSDVPLPVIVVIHGGGWVAGARGGAAEGGDMLSRGCAVASIGYRLGGDAPFPAQIEDCKTAVRWLRAHAKEYHLDPERFAAVGGSAGAHLAALLGTSGGVKGFDVGAHLDQSSRVQVVVDYCGPTDIVKFVATKGYEGPSGVVVKLLGGSVAEKRALAERANPITHLTKDAPPFFIVHGDQDAVVPINQSELLFEALKKSGAGVRLHVVRGAGHMDLFKPNIREMQIEVLERVLKGKADPMTKQEAIQTESAFVKPESK